MIFGCFIDFSDLFIVIVINTSAANQILLSNKRKLTIRCIEALKSCF